ncbi:hypothetical protein QPX96_05185 [Limosilactobacillus fermentum]|nr:hypothetical protein [Limosilactobacillus fermentum]
MMRNVKRRHFDRQIARGIVTSIKSSLKEVTKCGHHRSQRATLTEMAIRVSGFKKTLSTPTKLADALQRAAVESERPFNYPVTLSSPSRLRRAKWPVASALRSTRTCRNTRSLFT